MDESEGGGGRRDVLVDCSKTRVATRHRPRRGAERVRLTRVDSEVKARIPKAGI